MAWRAREIVEFGGLRTYFFPNLALYTAYNSQFIVTRPDKANPVAAYVFGASEKVPTEQEIVNILVPDHRDAETLATGMDACLALGGNFQNHSTTLQDHLHRLNLTHDLESPRKNDRILSILLKLINTDSEVNKKEYFDLVCDLCPLDLDFDAYVLCKLSGFYEDEKMKNEYAEELEMIKGNVIEMLEKSENLVILADSMKNGPLPELSRLLASPLDTDTAQKLVNLILESYSDDLTSSISAKSLAVLYRLNSQLHFLLIRSICSPESPDNVSILSCIPNEIRRYHVFPGLQNNRVETTMEFARGVIEGFNSNFDTWTLPIGILELMENPYSKNAITDILDAFLFAVKNSKELFDEVVDLVPGSKKEDLVETVITALRFATWIIQNWDGTQNLQNFSSLKDLYFLNPAKIGIYVDAVKKAFEPTPISTETVKKEPMEVVEPTRSEETVGVVKEEPVDAVEDVKVTQLLESVASKLERSVKKEEKKVASRWDALDQDYGKEKKRHGSSGGGKALRVQSNNEQNLPPDTRHTSTQIVKQIYKDKEPDEELPNPREVLQEPIPEKKSSSRYHHHKYKNELVLQENPEAQQIFTDEQWALNAPPPPEEELESQAPPTPKPPRKRFPKRPKVRPEPTSNFSLTGFSGARLCENFGKDLVEEDEQKTTRRLFGGIGVGEKKKYSGMI